MNLSLIVAVAENGVIGRGGGLPWRLSADLARFKRITMGHTLMMGRKTYESIGRPLPGRRSIVISRRPDFHPEGVSVAASLPAALAMAAGDEQVFVIGGGEIFREALPLAGRIYLTRVHATMDGDVHFALPNLDQWRRLERTEHTADETNEFATTFDLYERAS